MTLTLSVEHNTARLDATVAFADAGSNPASISLYTGEQPALGAEPGIAPLVNLVLAKPCARVEQGVITLHQQEAEGDLITASGRPTWARWRNGQGALVADGTVSGEAGTGDFKVTGDPEDPASGFLFAGARARLSTSTLG